MKAIGNNTKMLVTKPYLVIFYLNRKTHLSRAPTAILAFKWTNAHPTPSVFHADQLDVCKFLIRTLGLEFWGHPYPHGGPQHQQGQGLIFQHTS